MTTPDPSAPANAVWERRYSLKKLNRVAGTGAGARVRVRLTGTMARPTNSDTRMKGYSGLASVRPSRYWPTAIETRTITVYTDSTRPWRLLSLCSASQLSITV